MRRNAFQKSETDLDQFFGGAGLQALSLEILNATVSV